MAVVGVDGVSIGQPVSPISPPPAEDLKDMSVPCVNCDSDPPWIGSEMCSTCTDKYVCTECAPQCLCDCDRGACVIMCKPCWEHVAKTCDACEVECCPNCVSDCWNCGGSTCHGCKWHCSKCGDDGCRDSESGGGCFKWCEHCDMVYCTRCIHTCSECGDDRCDFHGTFEQCKYCPNYVCGTCGVRDGFDELCHKACLSERQGVVAVELGLTARSSGSSRPDPLHRTGGGGRRPDMVDLPPELRRLILREGKGKGEAQFSMLCI